MSLTVVSDATVPRSGHKFTRYLLPLTVFAVSRLGLLLVAYLSLIFLPIRAGEWRTFPKNLFLDGWARWDAGWYRAIAEEGYTNVPRNKQGQRDTAFFPLYPISIRVVKTALRNTFLSGLVVSNVAFLIALLVLFQLISDYYDVDVAWRSITLLAVYPFSFYFSAMYSESVFLLAAVCAFYLGERRQWMWAALCAAIAGATRLPGVAVVLGLALLYLEKIDFDWRKIRADILWLPLGLLGLGSYMTFLAIRFGDPLQCVKSHYALGWQAGMGLEGALATIRASLSLPSIVAGHYPAMNLIHLSIFPIALALCALIWRQRHIAYAVWATLMVVASFFGWQSGGRYLMIVFPLFVVAALLLKGERRYQIAVYISTLLLAMFTILYTHWYWVA